ncbi:MAG: D-sedoheptulose 7-phosphate isomerase [Prevotella sp.]
MNDLIKHSLQEAHEELMAFMTNSVNIAAIAEAGHIMSETLKQGGKIISCGNGGSLCDATHFAEELTGRYRFNRRSLPAIAINDPAYMTCVGNDFSFEDIYRRYVEGVGQAGDALLAISTSGNSENILWAVEAAHEKGMKVIGLTSEGGNKLSAVADVAVCAPRSAFSDRIQEIHIKVIHILIQLIEAELQVEKS